MRIRIVQTPPVACIDGVRLDQFEPGRLYDVGALLACLLVAERWAEPIASDEPALLIPHPSDPPAASPSHSRDLVRERIRRFGDEFTGRLS